MSQLHTKQEHNKQNDADRKAEQERDKWGNWIQLVFILLEDLLLLRLRASRRNLASRDYVVRCYKAVLQTRDNGNY